jgi:hypothetical protein
MKVLPAGRRAVRPGALRWVVAVALLLGLLGAVAVAAGTSPAERTFAAVSGPAQSLMSIVVPLLGVLATAGLQRPARSADVLPVIARALVPALLIAALGVLTCAAVTALAPSEAAGGRWTNSGVVVLGSLLVQGVALLVGTGMGLLLRPPIVAFLATIALPLGLWALLGAVAALRPAQPWTTPFPSVQHLLSGEMNPTRWAQWLVVLGIWGVALNAMGAARASRR